MDDEGHFALGKVAFAPTAPCVVSWVPRLKGVGGGAGLTPAADLPGKSEVTFPSLGQRSEVTVLQPREPPPS